MFLDVTDPPGSATLTETPVCFVDIKAYSLYLFWLNLAGGWPLRLGVLREVLPEQPQPHHCFCWLGQVCQGKTRIIIFFYRSFIFVPPPEYSELDVCVNWHTEFNVVVICNWTKMYGTWSVFCYEYGSSDAKFVTYSGQIFFYLA